MRPASSLLAAITDRAREAPHADAILEVRGARARARITRAALLRRVDQVVRGLRMLGFRPGDTVLFAVRPGIDATVLVLAIHELGGVTVPQDPGAADAVFAARTALLAPTWVMAESALLARPDGLVARLLRWRGVHLAALGGVPNVRRVRVGPRLPGLPPSLSIGDLEALGRDAAGAHAHAPPGTAATIERAAETEPAATIAAPCGPDAAAFTVCTSGTTSAPRAVVHTRRSLAAILRNVAAELAVGPADRVYGRDLHLVVPALQAGALSVMPRDLAFDADRTRRALAVHGITHAFFTTRDCRLLVEACERAGMAGVPEPLSATLRSVMIGAAPVRTPFLARLAPVLPVGCRAWCVYGATELLPIARVELTEKVAYDGDGDLVGRPLPGVHVRIDARGHLLVSGEALCRGYAGADPMMEHDTGDIARLDGDRLVLLGRAKDMIIRGDHNIYPELYEPLVERIPGVRRAAMVGSFDEARADERVLLVVEPEPGEVPAVLGERVRRAVREGPSRLDTAALPDEVIVAPLPESGRSRKVDKAALRRHLGVTAPADALVSA
jgi:acyl-CoA synthetase (AMP-forming)/AMP-acid ligase II